MADFIPVEKEAEMGVDYDEDEAQLGIASPVDGWELVGSRPGSPLPEACGNVTALEKAMASACSSGSLLQDDYFGCARSVVDDEVLPVSTSMAGIQNEDDGHISKRSGGLFSLARDMDAIGNCTSCNVSMFHGTHMDGAELTGHDDGMQHDDPMHDTDGYHDDDIPSCSNFMCDDDHRHRGVDVLHQHKMHDEFMMYPTELMERADRWPAKDALHFEGIKHIDDGDSARCINQLGQPCVEPMAAAITHHDVCAFGLSSGLESARSSSVSLHGTLGHSDMSMQQVLVEGRSSTVLLVEETGIEATSPGIQAPESGDAQQGTINTYDKREQKGFAYASWIWTHLIRWQTQFGHANTIWSVAVAAAVMGILVLGRGWQRLQAQNQSLRSQLWAKEKRITQLMFQLMQTKEALVKVKRVPVICVKPPLQIPQDNF